MESSTDVECSVELPAGSIIIGHLYVKVDGVYDEWTPTVWCMQQKVEVRRLLRFYRPAYGPNRSWTRGAWENAAT